ncbi:MAG: tRNA dihydrouridine synthase [Cellulosilyticaceae bacterium]
MKFYFAPMEGITGYIYRNAHATFFNQVDKYFIPFISPNQHGRLSTKELHDILPEHNTGLVVIPQILTNNATDFIRTCHQLESFGHHEVNLNLGCPSGTVVAKHKGSGFLAKREDLDRFLDEIFTQSLIQISIKTRIGKDEPDEFYKLIEIFNKYPMTELIVHPRTQKDYYKNTPNMTVFKDAVALSKNPLVYNGNICTPQDYTDFCEAFPSVDTLMIGRGLLSNPGLLTTLTQGSPTDKQLVKVFHDKVYLDYQQVLSGERNVLFKMKELWFYMSHLFPSHEKHIKKIKKSQRFSDYEQAVLALFNI